MADSIIKINSITELHEKMNALKPVHPLVSALKGEEFSVPEPLPSGTQISRFLPDLAERWKLRD